LFTYSACYMSAACTRSFVACFWSLFWAVLALTSAFPFLSCGLGIGFLVLKRCVFQACYVTVLDVRALLLSM
jgi:hypothetical protein